MNKAHEHIFVKTALKTIFLQKIIRCLLLNIYSLYARLVTE